jgi:2-oxo-4-hydroxy-4-carboxy--5-ureidoimidazoline (OHCU) decarboxylase
MQRRMNNTPAGELTTALGEVEKIAQLRLNDLLASN